MVVVSLAYLSFRGEALAAFGGSEKFKPLARAVAPEIFRKPLLVISIVLFLSSFLS
jgi:hypothetical protein